jgi:hypothetical protein
MSDWINLLTFDTTKDEMDAEKAYTTLDWFHSTNDERTQAKKTLCDLGIKYNVSDPLNTISDILFAAIEATREMIETTIIPCSFIVVMRRLSYDDNDNDTNNNDGFNKEGLTFVGNKITVGKLLNQIYICFDIPVTSVSFHPKSTENVLILKID